jgi:hypothetical protein
MSSQHTPSGMAAKVPNDGYIYVDTGHAGWIVIVKCGNKEVERVVSENGRVYVSRTLAGKTARVEYVRHTNNPPVCDNCGEAKHYVEAEKIHGWFCTKISCSVD